MKQALVLATLTCAAAFAPQPHRALATRSSALAPPPLALAPPPQRAAVVLDAARKKTADMTEEEKLAEKEMNQKLLAAKGALFLLAIAYFASTQL